MKRIMILGIGNAQVDAINYCKQLGVEVHGCSNTTGYKGFELIDSFVQLDVKDYIGISKYAAAKYIDVIYTIGSDIAMPAAMRASELLNLPHYLSYETALICQNKDLLRNFLGSTFKGNLPFITAKSLSEALKFDQFPCMMKPVDSQAQRGCFRINNREDLRLRFDITMDYSFSKRVILEKYIDGAEVSVNVFLKNGVIVFNLISDRIVFDEYPGGVIKEHCLPSISITSEGQKNIYEMVEKIIHKLGVINGPMYFQIKMDGDVPYLIEVTPRLDGCHMWKLIKHYCEVDLLAASLDGLICPEKLHEFSVIPNYDVLKLKFMCERPGFNFDQTKYIEAISGKIKEVHWYYETGELVMKQNGYMEKGGYFICE